MYLYQFKKELASLGLDRLKQALQALGLKCGGWVLLTGHMMLYLMSLAGKSSPAFFLCAIGLENSFYPIDF